MINHVAVDSLTDALRRGRVAAELTIADAIRDGQTWKEETVTDNLLRAVRPYVKYTTFTRKEESRTGADWMWWWVDRSGEAFGMMIQAKRPHGRKGRETYDVGAKDGQQLSALLRTASDFGLAPLYSFYAEPEVSGLDGDPRSVSLVSALVVDWAQHFGYSAAEWRARGIPMESLPASSPSVQPMAPVIDAITDPAFLGFLRNPQSGARNVAKHLLAQVAIARSGQAGLAVAERRLIDASLVFTELPTDRGHFGEPYFPLVLRGLRSEPPAYVLDILADQQPDQAYGEFFDGVAVITL